MVLDERFVGTSSTIRRIMYEDEDAVEEITNMDRIRGDENWYNRVLFKTSLEWISFFHVFAYTWRWLEKNLDDCLLFNVALSDGHVFSNQFCAEEGAMPSATYNLLILLVNLESKDILQPI